MALLERTDSNIRGIKTSFVHCSSSLPCRAVIVPSLREIEEWVQRGGRQLLSDASCLSQNHLSGAGRHSAPLSISTYAFLTSSV